MYLANLLSLPTLDFLVTWLQAGLHIFPGTKPISLWCIFIHQSVVEVEFAVLLGLGDIINKMIVAKMAS